MRTRMVFAVALALAAAPMASAYQLIEYLNPAGQKVRLKWGQAAMPVRFYFSSSRSPRDFSLDQAITTARASFDTWQAIETSSITFQYAGTTTAEPFVFFDFINTLGFVTDPELEGTGILGATNWIVVTATGEIAESDIFFNNAYPWSVAPGGTAGRFDFQSVATHEIGHFLGLGHSDTGVMESLGDGKRRLVEGSAIMFPFAYPAGSTVGRTPVVDDIIGASVLYPTQEFTSETGRLSGSVKKDGRGVFGAYINFFNPFTGELFGFFTGEGGEFQAEGLKAGPYVIRVNPITDPTSPEDFGFAEDEVDMDFGDAFYQGRAEVTAGETTTGINVEVRR